LGRRSGGSKKLLMGFVGKNHKCEKRAVSMGGWGQNAMSDRGRRSGLVLGEGSWPARALRGTKQVMEIQVLQEGESLTEGGGAQRRRYERGLAPWET